MGQKVNPVSLRLHPENKRFDSCWFSEKQYAHSIHNNLKVETYYNAIFKQIRYPSASFFLEAAPRKCRVIVVFLNPTHLREQIFKQYTNATNRGLKRRGNTLFSTEKKTTPFYGLFKKKSESLGLFPPSLLTPSFLQSLKNKPLSLAPFFSDGAKNKVKNGKIAVSPENPLRAFIQSKEVLPLGNQGKSEKRNQDGGGPSFLQVKKSGLQKGRTPSLNKKPGFYQHDLSQKATQSRLELQGHSAGRTQSHASTSLPRTFTLARKNVWSSVIGLAISRDFVGRKKHQNLLSATSRFLLLQSFFSFPKERNHFGSFPSKSKEESPLLKNQKSRPFLLSPQLKASSANLGQDVHGIATGVANRPGKEEKGLFSNLQKSGIYVYHTESMLSRRLKSSCRVFFFSAQNATQNALFVAEEIVYQLERRTSFRQIETRFLKKEFEKEAAIKGVRVTCVGRIGGRAKKAQRARGESFKMGQTSLHLFDSKVSFASKTAFTPFGAVGVKVWICWK